MTKSGMRASRKVVLIFGDPGSGKSYLAGLLHERYDYTVISLDEIYVEFVKESFLSANGQMRPLRNA